MDAPRFATGFRAGLALACFMSDRPTPAEREAARALIARIRAADPKIRKADELLVCAAVALRAGEFNCNQTLCARAMKKEITRPSQVTDWVNRLEKLEQSMPSTRGGLLVQPEFVEAHGLSSLTVGPMVLTGTPTKRHAKRMLDADASTPSGSMRTVHSEVAYTSPPPEGESGSAQKRRVERHRQREKAALRSMSFGEAAAEYAAQEAARQRSSRA